MQEEYYAENRAIVGVAPVNCNPTVEENINERIRHYESEIARLKRSKEDLAPLLKMRVRDLRLAVEY